MVQEALQPRGSLQEVVDIALHARPGAVGLAAEAPGLRCAEESSAGGGLAVELRRRVLCAREGPAGNA